MHVTIKFALSAAGQKASLLAGGDGRREQTISVPREDQSFAAALAEAHVSPDGSAALNLADWRGDTVPHNRDWDAIPDAAALIADLAARKAAHGEAEAARLTAIREATLTALRERRTTRHADQVGVDREGEQADYGGVAFAEHRYEAAAWPHPSDPAVTGSPEAVAWETGLAAAKEASLELALAEARAKLPAILAAERAAAEAKAAKAAELAAAKVAMGGEGTDYLCRIENGAIANVPCWESHGRGKNWMAAVSVDPSAPGGLARTFATKAKGDCYYLAPRLAVGDAVEFGADYYSGGGRKSATRWYGFVVTCTEEAILLRPCPTGKDAVKLGGKFVAGLAASK